MIARVAISPGAVESLSTGGPADVFLKHASLCEAVEAHGFLVFGNEDEGREFVRKIKDSGPEVQAMWNKLVTGFRLNGRFMNIAPPCPSGLDDVADLRDFANGWTPDTDLAVVTDARASEFFGLPATVMCQTDPTSGIDIARAAAASVTGPLAGYKYTGRASVLAEGTSREVLWHDALLPIARVARSINLVDRHIFTNLGNRVASGRGKDSIIGWILDHLDRASFDGCRVTLIGYHGRPGDDPVDADAAADLVQQVFDAPGRRLHSIEVVTAQHASYLPHDRHISTNLGIGVSFLESFDELFEGDTVGTEEGVEFSYRSEPEALEKLQKSEGRFERDRSARRVRAYTR